MEDPTGSELTYTVETNLDVDEAMNGGEEEEEEEEEEILTAPEGTPIIINTTSGRQIVMKFSDDCYIAATLDKDESTIGVSEHLLGCLITMADMRYGGRKESYNRLKALQNAEVCGG